MAGFLGKTFDFARLRAVLAALSPGGGPASSADGAPRPEAAGARSALAALWGRSREHLAVERAKLGEALRADRTADALRALHNLTSLANMVGALPISEAARGVEARLRARESPTEAIARLDEALARFRPATGGGADGSPP